MGYDVFVLNAGVAALAAVLLSPIASVFEWRHGIVWSV